MSSHEPPETRPPSELDLEWTELVEELRLIIPGVEVLFGFLLILPFHSEFSKLGGFQRSVYLGALMSSATAVLLLISPSVNHRLRWRQGDKNALLTYATWMSIAATLLTALAMSMSVLLVSEIAMGRRASSVLAALLAGLFALFWYGLPLCLRLRKRPRG
jgi:hypothetical protein